IYLPNGSPVGTDKFAYKLAWMERLVGHTHDLLRREIPFVLAGDYNICPTDDDVYDPIAFRDDALCRLEARSRFRALLYLGLTDAYRVFHRETHRYTFWDYQAGRWNRDEGLRIDHLLLSPHAADRVAACEIDKKPRGKDRASDHTPIWCELAVWVCRAGERSVTRQKSGPASADCAALIRPTDRSCSTTIGAGRRRVREIRSGRCGHPRSRSN